MSVNAIFIYGGSLRRGAVRSSGILESTSSVNESISSLSNPQSGRFTSKSSTSNEKSNDDVSDVRLSAKERSFLFSSSVAKSTRLIAISSFPSDSIMRTF